VATNWETGGYTGYTETVYALDAATGAPWASWVLGNTDEDFSALASGLTGVLRATTRSGKVMAFPAVTGPNASWAPAWTQSIGVMFGNGAIDQGDDWLQVGLDSQSQAQLDSFTPAGVESTLYTSASKFSNCCITATPIIDSNGMLYFADALSPSTVHAISLNGVGSNWTYQLAGSMGSGRFDLLLGRNHELIIMALDPAGLPFGTGTATVIQP
jgi:hypothetical protein